MINILTEQNVRAQLATLRPATSSSRPTSAPSPRRISSQAREFIRRGEAVAREMAPRLAELSLSLGAYALYKREHPRIAEAPAPKIDFVKIEGTQYANPGGDQERARRSYRQAARHRRRQQRARAAVRHRRLRTHRLPDGRGARPAGPRRPCSGKVDGPDLRPLRAQLLDRFSGRDRVLAARRREAHVGQQPRRAVAERDRARPHQPCGDRVLPAVQRRAGCVRLSVRGRAERSAVPVLGRSARRRVSRPDEHRRTRRRGPHPAPGRNSVQVRLHLLQGQPDDRDPGLLHGAPDRCRRAAARTLGQPRHPLFPATRRRGRVRRVLRQRNAAHRRRAGADVQSTWDAARSTRTSACRSMPTIS